MSLLDKICNVEIKPDTRISDEDRIYCQINQKAYEMARLTFLELYEMWKGFVKAQEDMLSEITEENYLKERYYCVKGLSSMAIWQKLEDLPSLLINTLVYYFNGKYHVSVDTDTIKKQLIPEAPQYSWEKSRIEKYNEAMLEFVLTYEEILEQIFVQLGGRTFAERAVDELKEKCHNFAWPQYDSKPYYTVRNDTIQFQYGCSLDEWLSTPRWKIRDGMQDILRGISHFETQQTEHVPYAINRYLGYSDIYNPMLEFDLEKVKSCRMFKNHRVDIKFTSKEYANQFAEIYLGLVA